MSAWRLLGVSATRLGPFLCAFAGLAAETSEQPSGGCGTQPPAPLGESKTLSMSVGEHLREYRVHLPPTYDSQRPSPLVLDFHGYGATAESTEKYSGLSEDADEHRYVVVYPQSTGFVVDSGELVTSWNDLAGNASPGPEGPICAEAAFKYPHPPECGEPRRCNWASCHDDVGFIEQLLDRLETTLCVDLNRVYATGMSNGGMFVHRLGCSMPNRFAAIAPVGGTLARGFNCAPSPATPLSMMNVYGSRDDYVSQKGVESSDGYYYTAARDVIAKWASSESQDCDSDTTPYPTSADGKRELVCIQHDNCSTGAEVINCTWNGAHDWPETKSDPFGNDIIWQFFSKHSQDQHAN